MVIVPKNWSDFQHYKDRAPPWIKLHKGLLDNYDFQCLPVASRALAPMLWLLASEHEAGHIDATPQKLAFRLRLSEKEVVDALQPLVASGFFADCKQPASKVASKVKAKRSPETEAETEAEKTFGGFWTAWPKNDRKQDKAKCQEVWTKHELHSLSAVILADVQAKKQTAKWRQGYVEAPLVYLHNRRWEDGETVGGKPDWFLAAGFPNAFEANNEGCREHNAHLFRDGKRMEAA
jgi:hypothetical protein